MAKVAEEKRSVKITCRVRERVAEIINGYAGNSLGDRIDAMANEIMQLKQSKDTQRLVWERNRLLDEIRELKGTLKLMQELYTNIEHLNKHYTENIEQDRQLIAANVKEAGYLPTQEIVSMIEKVNEVTGHHNTVAEISDTYKNESYISQEHRECIEQLAESFRLQEMDNAMLPDMD